MDVAALRAEIKAWERSFRANHSRDPSIQEIKDQPAIAAKYKLYKSLSKAAPSGNLSHSARSSTPPPSLPRQPPASSILTKSRAVKVDPPVSTSNPFSPVKNRNKYPNHASSSQRASNQSRSNPFATPSKPKNKPHAPPRSPSPDPFPPIEPLLLVPRPPSSPAADSALTRARKRLRGEQVSPSPVKEKRARVSSQATLSFTGRAALLDSPDASDGDDFAADVNDSIIADTPMKPRTGGRNFKVLFDDALTNGERRPMKVLSSSHKKSASSASGSGSKREISRALTPSSDEEEDWSLKPRLKSLEVSAAIPARSGQSTRRIVNKKRGIPGAFVPTKDDLRADIGPASTSQSKGPPGISSSLSGASSSSSRAGNKRTFPNDLDDTNDDNTTGSNALLNLPLLPPSPPPPDASKPSGPMYAEKRRGKSGPLGRKKPKLLHGADGADDEGADSLEDDEIQVRELDPLAQLPAAGHVDDTGSDWEAHWGARQGSCESAALLASSVDPGRFEVTLPDELQRVLAISPGGRKRETEEEKVVRGLLYGSRETHYDAAKGGEIWDVGEESEHGEGTEEDWEGDPVPWEAGEL
ncbi:hypothetical protein DICSQDRAFT_158554 [Dichomitus squalens LYAD-421 SS1]|uniref:uncharacterized protein n=1 Tax=Dichomitus squalens (strain LYAD-421) TaxID=732165 RepID=UPI0004413E48|nr:uncharacterized protein DICSQDRAFT_158554 [Dichomitus squalens LYAD-421 SS1]EJF66913.1 hypothetical protein DICSQDRAFT_158554 [Dichomitus squalens LYAD-421 SS1]